MADANQNLSSIYDYLSQFIARQPLDNNLLYQKLDAIDASTQAVRAQTEITAYWAGDIRAYIEGIQQKMDTLNGKQQEILNKLEQVRQETQFQGVLIVGAINNLQSLLELQLYNLGKAICGDCTVFNVDPPPPPDPVDDEAEGYVCRLGVGGINPGPYFSTTPGALSRTFLGQYNYQKAGDTIRLRCRPAKTLDGGPVPGTITFNVYEGDYDEPLTPLGVFTDNFEAFTYVSTRPRTFLSIQTNYAPASTYDLYHCVKKPTTT